MVDNQTLAHEIKTLVKSEYYPLIMEAVREKFINRMVATDPVTGKDIRDYWHSMIAVLAEFDKELRIIADSTKYRT